MARSEVDQRNLIDGRRRIAGRRATLWTLVHVAALIAAATGCKESDRHGTVGGGTSATASAAPLNEAERLFVRMAEVYGRANSYADEGQLRMEFRKGDQAFEATPVPFSLALARPNQLRMHLYQSNILCDGQTMWGWTSYIADTVAKRPAPSALSLGEIYADEVLRTDFTESLAGQCLPLVMLCGADSLDLLRADGNRPEFLSDEYVEGRPCRRVRVRRADGDMVYWIDRELLILRRMEFPTTRLALTLADPNDPRLPTNVRMTAEFRNAQLNPQLPPEAFQFSLPATAKVVDKLDPFAVVPPPPPLSQMLGKPIGDFRFTGVDGRTVDRSTLAGKAAVVLFWSWATRDCLQTLAKVNDAYAKYRDRKDVEFWAVSIDPAGPQGVPDDALVELMNHHKFQVPVARLTDQRTPRDVFDTHHVPSLFIIGRDGVVQDNEVGLNRQLETELVARVETVAAGGTLTADAQRRHAERVARYEKAQAAQPGGGATPEALPKSAIAPAAPPKTLKMTTLWKCDQVAKPGFVLAAEESGSPRIVVVDGLDGIAELNGAGKVVRSQKLDLPKQAEPAIISYLRTGLDRSGKRHFIGSSGNQQQLHIFDADFKRTASFPEGTHAGLSDVQCADLDGDGASEMVVGYWGVVGMQGVSLDGSRLWSNRRLGENILKIAVTEKGAEGKRLILATTGLMTVAVLDHEGKLLKDMPIGSWTTRFVTCADLTGDGSSELAAVASVAPCR